ncbi:MAG: RNA 3'-terminal phosphate cyclase [Methanomethylovorans sp.]|jgi:RNA 3'-terminal phosphate cyclase (ATP)|nr:RNA 3'-terminal phosphate cyclase [Methanomethylovorans sp.]
MIEIDGSYGEGGGQILRTAIALASITSTDVRIFNIRAHRPQPGLKAQHMKAIETAAKLCNGDVEGLYIGSQEITYFPMEIEGGKYTIDIGTAGSISLLLQCIMPMTAFSSGDILLEIIGGTDVAWSPTIDYLNNVTCIALKEMGYRCNIEILQRGYYPEGGGKVRASFKPAKLYGFDFERKEENIKGISHSSKLPEHVAERQSEAAKRLLEKRGMKCEIDVYRKDEFSTGSGITLWSNYTGASSLGKKGVPAEKVGEMAAKNMIEYLTSGASVDRYLADQLITYMGIAGEGSFTTDNITKHTLTNIYITELFMDVKFDIQKQGNLIGVSVR